MSTDRQTMAKRSASGVVYGLERVALLIDRGADGNKPDTHGHTARHIASHKGFVIAAELLLDKGADVNRLADNGTTPLYMASAYGFERVVRLLIDRGADVNKAETHGLTALHIASHNGFHMVVEVLLNKGADVNRVADLGDTPLFHASMSGDYDKVARLLIEAGADVYKGINGATPLSIASFNGHRKVVRLIFEKIGLCTNNKADPEKNCIIDPIWHECLNINDGVEVNSQSQSKYCYKAGDLLRVRNQRDPMDRTEIWPMRVTDIVRILLHVDAVNGHVNRSEF